MPTGEVSRTDELKNKLLAGLREEHERSLRDTDHSLGLTSGTPSILDQSTIFSEISPTHYNNSTFPSLMGILGITATQPKKKKKLKPLKQKEVVVEESKVVKHRDTATVSFGEQMRRRNESQWLRIETVARENLEKYEERARAIYRRVRRQREAINKRSAVLLESLAQMEERKREEQVYQSSHGRMWRHHRSLQRRAYSLEPLRSQSRVSMLPPQSLADTELTV